MCRCSIEGLGVPRFDYFALVHDDDLVRHVLDHGEIVRDEHVRQLELVLQIEQQVEHGCLDRDVERRNGFVADDDFRPHREAARDRDALALTAGELVRVLEDRVGRHPDPA